MTRNVNDNSRLRRSRRLARCTPVLRLLAVLIASTACAAPPLKASPLTQVVILSGSHERYQEAAAACQAQLTSRGIGSKVIILPEGGHVQATEDALRALSAARPAVVATAGESATSLALQALPDTPVAYFMVPNASDAPFVVDPSASGHRAAGIAADVSPADQLEAIRRVQPQCRRVAVPHGSATRRTAEAFVAAGRRLGMEVVAIECSKADFTQAIAQLNRSDSDAVIMLADPQVYNDATVRELILWGLREKRAVWAFSGNLAKAGALGSQEVDPITNGQDAAGVVQELLDGKQPAQIGMRYSAQESLELNRDTADRVGVTIPKSLAAQATVHGGSS